MRTTKTQLTIIFILLGMFAINVNLKAGYDPTIGRFLNRDPVGEKGFGTIQKLGNANKNLDPKEHVGLYVFVENSPVNFWDMLGLTVYARFNNSKQRLSIIDNDRGGAITVKAFSGGEWKKGKFVPRMDYSVTPPRLKTFRDIMGPTIPGTYYLANPINGKKGWFVLLDDNFDAKYLYSRTGFYLHLGSVSSGCITVPMADAKSKSGWIRILAMMKKTKTYKLRVLQSFKCFTIYGKITVTE